jgi:hypothetical protein
MNSERSTSDNLNLKQEALNYYNLNSHVIKSVEQAINGLFYENPYDIFGYLVNKLFDVTFS